MTPRRIGFLGFEGLTALDLVGPMEAFASAFIEDAQGRPQRCYEVIVLGLTGKAFRASSGLLLKPNATLQKAPRMDTVIIPGGYGLREGDRTRQISSWILSEVYRIRRIAS